MHMSMMSAVNNDVLAEVLIAVMLLLLTRRILSGKASGVKSWVGLGVLLGCGLATKLTVYSIVPVILLAIYYSNAHWRQRIVSLVTVSLPAMAITFPLYIRNMLVYGDSDPFALHRHNDIVIGQLRTAEYIQRTGWPGYLWEFVTTSFQSFWGQFGWMAVPMHSRVYLFLALLSVLSASGLFTYFRRSWFRLALEQRRCLALFLLLIGISLLSYLWWNISFVQFQARYVFPALLPLSILFAIGLRKAFSRQMVLSGLIISALFTILAFSVTLGLGRLDKVSVLIPGVFTLIYFARLKTNLLSAKWLFGLAYTSLAALCAISPWWYIIPYLKL
jgi:4-amino-4-deoxy-L-arabinose transferase-like glycosyltransferase